MLNRTKFCLALSLCLSVPPAGAEPMLCPDTRFATVAPDPVLHDQICAIAADSSVRMQACGLALASPLLIEIVDEVEHPFADCLAAFDCDLDRIRITDPSLYPERIPSEEPYAALPGEVLLRALLTHELAHAMAEHSTPEVTLAPVDHEYIAAAMELDGLPPEWREHLLNRSRVETPLEGLINIWIYRLEPRRFAANAWLHFSDPANGCLIVERIIGGDFSFAANQD